MQDESVGKERAESYLKMLYSPPYVNKRFVYILNFKICKTWCNN